MELKTYIELANLAAYLDGVAVMATTSEAVVLNDAANKLRAIVEEDLPYQLRK